MKPIDRLHKERDAKGFITTLSIGVCITMTLLIAFIYVIASVDRFQASTVESLKESKREQFINIVNILENDAYNIVSKTAENIENDMMNNISLDDLREELDQNNYFHLSTIIEPYISNKYLNGVEKDGNTMFVATYKGIICDFSYTNSGRLRAHNNNISYRKWKDFISDSFNKDLAMNAIKQIKNKSTDLIVFQYTNPCIDDMEIMDRIDVDDLYNIYTTYGLKGLKSFELLVPAYITEDGDIFGQKDIVQGVRYNNYKIIVIQRINLYDQITALYSDFEDEEPINEVISKYSFIKDEIRILGLIIVIIYLSAIAHFCNVYNKRYMDD